MTLLFLCTGNIHRSPLAAALLAGRLRGMGRDDVEVLSAGTIGIEGHPAVPEAIRIGSEAGLDLSDHRSRRANGGLLREADRIVVMETAHVDWVRSVGPDVSDRVVKLGEFATPETGLESGADIPDAIGEGFEAFRRTFAIIRSCVANLANELPEPPQDTYARAIADRFQSRRGDTVSLSSTDWGLIERWWRSRTPLWIILEAIDEMFDRKSARGAPREIGGLSYCRPMVRERSKAHQERRRRDADRPAQPSPGPVSLAVQRLESAAIEIAEREPRVAALLRGAAKRLREMRPRDEFHEVRAIDAEIIDACRAMAGDPAIEQMGREADEMLEEHRGRMTDEAYRLTRLRYVEDRLRKRFGIPDLG